MAEPLCVCALVPRLFPRTQVLVIAHPHELGKPTNTGRFVSRSLAGAALMRHGELRDDPPAGSAVLFPSEDSVPLDASNPPSVLYVPDGTYRQARRILKREARLASVPRVALPETVRAVGHMRRDVRLHHLSTYEAVARALGVLEGDELEAPMLTFLEIVIKRTLWFRGSISAAEVPGGVPPAARQS